MNELSKNKKRKEKRKLAMQRNSDDLVVGLKLDTMIEVDSKNRLWINLTIVITSKQFWFKVFKIVSFVSIIYSSGWSALNWQMIVDLFV